jgi:undecaprenyl-diphosphatase
MKPWERACFSISSLAILITLAVMLHELDMPMARFVRSFNIDTLNRIGNFLALPGQGEVLAGVFLVIGLLGWGLHHDLLKGLGVRGLAVLLGAAAVTQLLKHLIGRPRPRFAHSDDLIVGPSLASGLDAFPSGHTLSAFGAAALVAWFVPALKIPLFLTAGLVGLSRVLRGSHFPTDVFAAAILGVLVGTLGATGFRRWGKEALPGLLRIGMPLVVSVFLILWVVLHPSPDPVLDLWQLTVGAGLILAGFLFRGLGIIQSRTSYLPVLGMVALVSGVAVAAGQWWGAGLLVLALVPMSLGAIKEAPLGGGAFKNPRGSLSFWSREVLTVSAAVLAVAALRLVSGILPLG